MKARIHSFESFGTVDGPGIRFVIFMQGCNFRCRYCHNPDTWASCGGEEYSVSQVMEKIRRFKPYFASSGGGITVSGGEPLMQKEFLTELFKECKKEGIHTAIDTNGFEPSKDNEYSENIVNLLKFTDLVLLDIKHMSDEIHVELTGQTNRHTLRFAQYLDSINKPVWIRYVLVPNLTNDDLNLRKLKVFLKDLKNVEKVEILPFHKLGEYKWKELNLEYKLNDTPFATENDVEKVNAILKM